jgi:hypothetical protein
MNIGDSRLIARFQQLITETLIEKRLGVLAGTRSDRRCLVERSGFGVPCR